MKVEVVKLDNEGRGIGYINDKIIFIPKCIPGDIVNVKIVKEKKNYIEGELLEIITPSKKRVDAICPLFFSCGGCDLMSMSLSETLEYKLNKVNEIFKKNKIDYDVSEIIKSEESNHYRNKITLKVVDKKIGFFKNETHDLIEVKYCYLADDAINDFILDISLLNICNGTITIRSNYKRELLVSISSKEKIKNIELLIQKHKIVGIIQNDECIYGEKYFIDKIGKYLFKISYNSFFQVNPFICAKLFSLIEENILDSSKIIDLYCGVGTLGIVSQNGENKVYGVEIVENAIEDANFNKKLNNKENINFLCSDIKNAVNLIDSTYNTIILDPPRSGVEKKVLEKIVESKIKKIIYVSCNPLTLTRDLKLLLENYHIKDMKLLDMFPYTGHVESICILNYNEI